jgi:hypothetical protein
LLESKSAICLGIIAVAYLLWHFFVSLQHRLSISTKA